MVMKKTLLLSTVLLLSGLSSFAQWVPQMSGISDFVTSVFFVNADTGYVSAFGGTILKTTNAGKDWVPQSS